MNIIFIPTPQRKKLRLSYVKSPACIHTVAMCFHSLCFEPLQTPHPPKTAHAAGPWEVGGMELGAPGSPPKAWDRLPESKKHFQSHMDLRMPLPPPTPSESR